MSCVEFEQFVLINCIGELKRIHELCSGYEALSYPVMNAYGEPGFIDGLPRKIPKRLQKSTDLPGVTGGSVAKTKTNRRKTTVRRVQRMKKACGILQMTFLDYCRFKIAYRPTPAGVPNIPYAYGRLCHQFIVDLFARKQQNDINWIRRNQTKIRAGLYKGTF